MNKLTLIIAGLILMISGMSMAQVQEPIKVEKRLGTVFIQNGKVLKPRDLINITQVNPEALKSMQQAKKNYDAGAVFGFIGGFMVGWPCGTAIAGGDPEWALAGIGAGLIAVSIPFSTAYVKHTKKAVSIYNDGLPADNKELTQVDFGITSGGIGFTITF
ncbi:hypothetical protein [Carboxylicivirga marina]|uniref:Uncharacterized protein n=1 Tax=Carboxylicivirga marina TaxID=2800988 RepID=A0ABS1HP32_9BACT|nr:hypothetical protein [Carboxylicivirga marina]MBK3519459.1 hypothetical protein [Carboxylicivirga marina]